LQGSVPGSYLHGFTSGKAPGSPLSGWVHRLALKILRFICPQYLLVGLRNGLALFRMVLFSLRLSPHYAHPAGISEAQAFVFQ
jgi:hypothetical protein